MQPLAGGRRLLAMGGLLVGFCSVGDGCLACFAAICNGGFAGF